MLAPVATTSLTFRVTALRTRSGHAAARWRRCSSSRARARSFVAPCQRAASRPARARPTAVSRIIKAMVIDMNQAQVRTVEPVRHVPAGTQELEFRRSEDDEGRYGRIAAVLKRFDYGSTRGARCYAPGRESRAPLTRPKPTPPSPEHHPIGRSPKAPRATRSCAVARSLRRKAPQIWLPSQRRSSAAPASRWRIR